MCNSNNNRFRSTRNGSTFTCDCCGKRTRDTGHDEASNKMCLACILEGEIQIAFSDYSDKFTKEQEDAFHDRLSAANANQSDADTKAIRKIHEEVFAIAYA
jgi:hypothetical protein